MFTPMFVDPGVCRDPVLRICCQLLHGYGHGTNGRLAPKN